MINVDFPKLVNWLLPSFKRKPGHQAWLNALLKPLRDLYAQFLAYVSQTRVELSYNSQKIMFEKALNDVFDPVLRRIYIDGNESQLSPLYLNFLEEQQEDKHIYFQSEGKPPRYLHHWHEYANPIGFRVYVPVELQPREPATQKIILRLKLACVRYEIVYY